MKRLKKIQKAGAIIVNAFCAIYILYLGLLYKGENKALYLTSIIMFVILFLIATKQIWFLYKKLIKKN